MVELSEKSGVSRSYLTEFRKGKGNPTVEVVERLLAVMEDKKTGARAFFYLNCAGGTITLRDRIHQLSIDSATDRKEAADALRLIVAKFIPEDREPIPAVTNSNAQVSENTDESKQLNLLKSL